MGRSIIVRFSYRTVVVPVFFIRSPRYALLVPDTTIVRVEFQLKFDLAAVARAGAESEAFQQRACRPVAWAGSRVGRSFGWPSPWASGRSVGKWRFGAVSFAMSRYMFGIFRSSSSRSASVTGVYAYAVLVRMPTASLTGLPKNLVGALILRLSLPRLW